MRLLLRAAAHRELGDGRLEIAASPDTPRREAWRWHVRLLPADAGPSSDAPAPHARRTVASLPGGRSVEVAADLASVTSALDVLAVGDGTTVQRAPDEIVVLIACGGALLVEERHLLADADALVLEGEDPPSARVQAADGGRESVAVVRLRSPGGAGISWVP